MFPRPPVITKGLGFFFCGSSPGRIPEGSTQQCADHLALQHFDARFPQTGILSAEREPFCVVPTMRAVSNMTPACLVFSALRPNSPRDAIPGLDV